MVAVIGSDGSDALLSKFSKECAELIGKYVARKNGIIVCGGRGGIMRAVCKGAKSEKGITVGIMPYSKSEANEFVDIPISTGLGHKRNFLVINSSDVVIALGGRWGTLNEISYAMVSNKPLILMKGTGGCVDEIVEGCIMQNIESSFYVAESAIEAVEKAFKLIV
jgi:uncharacterized protein (TIGR00725 family)